MTDLRHIFKLHNHLSNKIMIRFATIEDIDTILELCKEHADYEKATYSTNAKKENLSRALFSNTPALYCLLAEVNDQVVGYATYMIQYSTWDAAEYIYMDCLYLREQSRGHGLGEKLVNKIKEEGIKKHCDLVQWQTPDFNKRAIKFYHRIGAHSKNKERFFLDI